MTTNDRTPVVVQKMPLLSLLFCHSHNVMDNQRTRHYSIARKSTTPGIMLSGFREHSCGRAELDVMSTEVQTRQTNTNAHMSSSVNRIVCIMSYNGANLLFRALINVYNLGLGHNLGFDRCSKAQFKRRPETYAEKDSLINTSTSVHPTLTRCKLFERCIDGQGNGRPSQGLLERAT